MQIKNNHQSKSKIKIKNRPGRFGSYRRRPTALPNALIMMMMAAQLT